MNKRRDKKVAIVIAAYNEEATILKVVTDVRKFSDKVIVVNDCSSDETGKIARNAGAIVIEHSINLGQGASLQTGFDFIKKHSLGDVVVTYDADDQFLAQEIPLLCEPIEKNTADVSLGSRFLGETYNLPFFRKLVLKMGILFTWIFSDIKLTDTHNGFRAFSIEALNSIEILQNRMAHASEIIDQIARKKLRYVEVPVTVKYNIERSGQGNIGMIHILRDLLIEKFS
jgi:glycosyltransferase involved in cell wall biosynthesis